MSTCDRNLSGDDVKVVQYTVLSNESNLNDDNRILIKPGLQTIAFSDDMTEDGFVSWIIAKHCADPKNPLLPADPKHIRVCFCVMCRVPKAEDDCCENQAYELRRIADHLINPPPKLPAKK